jgi:hypothetical protein
MHTTSCTSATSTASVTLSPASGSASTAADLGIPEEFNVATYFVDRNVAEGRAEQIAIECGNERVTYQRVLERTSRAGSVLRNELGVRPEQRVLLLMLDGPECGCSARSRWPLAEIAIA